MARPEPFPVGPSAPSERPVMLSSFLLGDCQPIEWIGRLFLDPSGCGTVWTGARILRVQNHRIVPPAPPEYVGLYAVSIAVTHHWWSRERSLDAASDRSSSDPAVLDLVSDFGRDLRHRVNIPFTVDYLLLLPAKHEEHWPFARAYVQDQGEVRPPRDVVPVSRKDFDSLAWADRYRPRLEDARYFRVAAVTPAGLLAVDEAVFTDPDACPKAPVLDTELLVVTWTEGLPADAVTIDGESFCGNVMRVPPDRFDGIHLVIDGYVGQFVADPEGNGFVYDGRTLRSVVKRVIEAPGASVNGFPVWVLALLKRARVTPDDIGVHGVMLSLTRAEAVSYGFDSDVEYVLLASGRTKDDIRVASFSKADLVRFVSVRALAPAVTSAEVRAVSSLSGVKPDAPLPAARVVSAPGVFGVGDDEVDASSSAATERLVRSARDAEAAASAVEDPSADRVSAEVESPPVVAPSGVVGSASGPGPTGPDGGDVPAESAAPVSVLPSPVLDSVLEQIDLSDLAVDLVESLPVDGVSGPEAPGLGGGAGPASAVRDDGAEPSVEEVEVVDVSMDDLAGLARQVNKANAEADAEERLFDARLPGSVSVDPREPSAASSSDDSPESPAADRASADAVREPALLLPMARDIEAEIEAGRPARGIARVMTVGRLVVSGRWPVPVEILPAVREATTGESDAAQLLNRELLDLHEYKFDGGYLIGPSSPPVATTVDRSVGPDTGKDYAAWVEAMRGVDLWTRSQERRALFFGRFLLPDIISQLSLRERVRTHVLQGADALEIELWSEKELAADYEAAQLGVGS